MEQKLSENIEKGLNLIQKGLEESVEALYAQADSLGFKICVINGSVHVKRKDEKVIKPEVIKKVEKKLKIVGNVCQVKTKRGICGGILEEGKDCKKCLQREYNRKYAEKNLKK